MKRQSRRPLISVIMPVYNAGSFLVDSIESILNQTHKNLEFIIVDDASTDQSVSIIESYAKKDSRIVMLHNRSNLGVSESARKAIKHSRGDYIARMDADDITSPTRLEKQLKYLKMHPDTVAVGGQCYIIDKEGLIIGQKRFPRKSEDLYNYLFSFVPLQQGAMMIAKNRLPKDFIFYQDGLNTAEEVELFFKLFQHGKIHNLNDFLLKYRIHDTNTSLVDIRATYLLTLLTRIKSLYRYGYKPSAVGILMTLLQALIVLILPKPISLFLYKLNRRMLHVNFPRFYPLKPFTDPLLETAPAF